mmetsp:Transcript_10050/g.26847  ORF Transcript_10050/g.26847 Transcript_10050/m.26847 type:complete len:296 (-) Transcript_10050:306-1193(-)
MFYDLGASAALRSQQNVDVTVARLGYHVVAFEVAVKGGAKPPPADLSNAPAPALAALFETATRQRSGQSSGAGDGRKSSRVHALSRVTLEVHEAAQLTAWLPLARAFDITAVRPGSEKMLQLALASDGVDIIALDHATAGDAPQSHQQHRALPFRLRRQHIHVAREKGVSFELRYGALVRSSGSRRAALSVASDILRVSGGGRNVILSSGARHAMEFRGVYDVENLLVAFCGITRDDSRALFQRNAAVALQHAHIRESTYKGAVVIERILPAVTTEPSPALSDSDDDQMSEDSER